MQTTFTFLSIAAGSGAIALMSAQMPVWLTVVLAVLFAIFGAVNIAVRPADKVALNDSDVRKYAVLMTKAESVDGPTLRQLLAEARQSDVPEVEPLREIAYNDVALEKNRAYALIPLRALQKVLGAFA